jgi:hypothetical protein
MYKNYSLDMANKMLKAVMLKAVRQKELKNEKSEVVELFVDWLLFVAENSDNIRFI